MRNRTIETVDAWRSPGCDTRYSVSLSDEDGEIRCVGGSNSKEAAWKMALKHAKEHGVPARLMPTESGEVTREERPE